MRSDHKLSLLMMNIVPGELTVILGIPHLTLPPNGNVDKKSCTQSQWKKVPHMACNILKPKATMHTVWKFDRNGK